MYTFSWCRIDSYIQLRALFWFDTHRSIFYFKFKHYTVTRPKASGSSFRFKGEVTGLVKDRDKTGTRQGQDRDKTGQVSDKTRKRQGKDKEGRSGGGLYGTGKDKASTAFQEFSGGGGGGRWYRK